MKALWCRWGRRVEEMLLSVDEEVLLFIASAQPPGTTLVWCFWQPETPKATQSVLEALVLHLLELH